MTVQADLNVSKCLVSNSAWGENVITNVCSGEVTRVPWQAGDYAEAIGVACMATLMILIMAVVARMFWQIITDY